MGCCSSCLTETYPEKQQQPGGALPASHPHLGVGAGGAAALERGNGVPAFAEFSLADLKAATNGFSSDNIVSESGEKASNVVYRGRLQNRRWIAVKKFGKMAWPDPKQFAVSSPSSPTSICPSSTSLPVSIPRSSPLPLGFCNL